MNTNELMVVIEECREELKKIGIEVPDAKFESMKSKAKWGECQCRRVNRQYSFKIRLNVKLFDGSCESLIPLKSTIIHEMLHAAAPFANHGHEWKRLAHKVNSYYPMYHIQRTDSYKQYGLTIDDGIAREKLYIVKCQKCGKEYTRQRFSKLIAKTRYFRCGICHGELKLVQTPVGVNVMTVANNAR